jgi:hypothetical protein
MAAPANNGQISPPNTPIGSSGGQPITIAPEWYRYFVKRQATTDGINGSAIVTLDDQQSVFPNSRKLTVTSGQLTENTGSANVELGLADSGVTAATYGAPTKLVVLAIDAKGRITAASEVVLNSDNVTEGTTHLFFTQARARASVSGASGISYNSGTGQFTLDQAFTRGLLSGGSGISYNSSTGAISTSGFSGGPAAYTSFTFANGICTAAS